MTAATRLRPAQPEERAGVRLANLNGGCDPAAGCLRPAPGKSGGA